MSDFKRNTALYYVMLKIIYSTGEVISIAHKTT